MIKKKLFLLLTCLIYLNNYSGFTENSLIKLTDDQSTIGSVTIKNDIISFDPLKNINTKNHIVAIFKRSTEVIYQISIPTEIILCTGEQLFYDPTLQTWIPAKAINTQNFFLDINGALIPCLRIEKNELDTPIDIYDISLSPPHTFFISQTAILTHNIVPIIIGLSWTIGEGIALSGAGIGVGALGLGLWHQRGKHKRITFAQIEQECNNSSTGNAPDPEDENKAGNMREVFKNHPIGKQLKNSSRKTKFNVQGQTVWQAATDIENLGIHKGDLFYLDNLHKDHIEVFCSKGKMPLRTIVNLDGSINVEKINQAGMRYLSRYIG